MALKTAGISVIICCHNSSKRLPETLKYLAGQNVPENFPWEVIVVDNSSSDTTSSTATNELKNYEHLSGKYKIVTENNPGLTYARVSGAKEARYKYIVFCDDDNWLDTEYIYNAYNLITKNKEIGAIGGFSRMATDSKIIPDWFENYQSRYAVGAQAKVQGDVSKLGPLWGAGLVTRKNLFLNCSSKNYPFLLTDRKKDQLTAGGDTEFCLRLLLKGYRLYYDETLQLTHFIPQARLTLGYKKRIETDGLEGSKEMVKYVQLYNFVTASNIKKPWIVLKTILGFLSAVILKRKSWSFQDVLRIFYYATTIDLGMDYNTKQIYRFYKHYNFNTTNPILIENSNNS